MRLAPSRLSPSRSRSRLPLSRLSLLLCAVAPCVITGPAAAASATPVVVSLAGPPGHVIAALHVRPTAVFDTGFAARLTPAQVRSLQGLPGTVVEPDRPIRLTSTTQAKAGWGLDRIDQRSLPLNGLYRYSTTAGAVHAYVIDTGIDLSHPDFGGRARAAFDAFGGSSQDCNGHGTHVAGIIGGKAFGVAKRVELDAVRVMACDGQGTTASVLAGIDWVRTHAVKPAVANLSIGGSLSTVLNRAVTALSDSGVLVTVAAGNSGTDACATSPASARDVLAVAATDRTDTRASFSNLGSCVDLYAPGVAITSDWLAGKTRSVSGTSMASPFVAGAAALWKARHGDVTSATLGAWLRSHTTTSVVKRDPSNTPNRLLYTGGI